MAGDFGGRPFLADIGDDHDEDRRQQQALEEAEGDERRHVRRERHQHGRHDQRDHRRGDHALAAQHVGERAGERRSQRDGERATP